MKTIIAIAAIAGLCGGQAWAKDATFRDALRVTRISEPAFSPDGRTIAAVETGADLENDEFRSEILLIDANTGQSRPLTRERHHAGMPRWSPDGLHLAFLAPDSDKNPQIFILPLDGGDAQQITKVKDGVQQFAWSPDSLSIAYAASDPKPELKGEASHRQGFTVGNDDFTISEAVRPTHVWVIPSSGGEARRLTSGSWSLPPSLPPGPPSSPLKWSPDGKSLIITRQETPSTGDGDQTRIQVLDVASGKARDLTGAKTFEGYGVISPDGASVAYWKPRNNEPWRYQDVWIAPFSGGPGADISIKLDKNIYGTIWSADSRSLIVGANTSTTVGLWRLALNGDFARIPTGDIAPVNGYWVDMALATDGRVAFSGQTAADPDELYVTDPAGGTPKQLTHVNAALADLELARSETITWKGPGGRMLEGVLTYPKGYKAGTRNPLVLFIHGGPNSASKQRFNLAPQVLAARGFLVFEPNYRGSDSAGDAFFASIYKDAGQGPGEDVMSGVEFLKRQGLVDPAQMAVTGWSYGGYMTVWLAGHYPAWKAAVAGAPVTDWVEDYDLSDGNVLNRFAFGSSPYVGDGMRLARAQSPSSMMTHIRAPTLIMTDTGDFRVPPMQAFGLYRALKDNGVTTEFIAYPTGGHFPGDPIQQIDVYERWIAWVEKYLK